MTSPYGMREVFNLVFFDSETGVLLFSTTSAVNFEMRRSFGRTTLSFSDSCFDLQTTNNFLSGIYDEMMFKIVGHSLVRSANTGRDLDIELIVEEAKFSSYHFDVEYHSPATPKIKFDVIKSRDEIFKKIDIKRA